MQSEANKLKVSSCDWITSILGPKGDIVRINKLTVK